MGITQKINPESVAYFSISKSDRQQTTIHHDSTTNSPSKDHVLPPVFAKTPCKTHKPASRKLLHTMTCGRHLSRKQIGDKVGQNSE
jgi:hypothetical protein